MATIIISDKAGDKEWLQWMQESIDMLCGLDVESIGLVAITKNDEESTKTGYYNASCTDMALMEQAIQSDKIVEIIKNNGFIRAVDTEEFGDSEDDE